MIILALIIMWILGTYAMVEARPVEVRFKSVPVALFWPVLLPLSGLVLLCMRALALAKGQAWE